MTEMSDVVAPLIAVFGTLGGVGLTGSFADRARRQAAGEREETRRAAHDLWLRERQSDAYVGFLKLMSRMMGFIRSHIIAVEINGTFDEIPREPPVDEQAAAVSAMNAFAHPSILSKVETWDQLIHDGMFQVGRLHGDRTDTEALQALKVIHRQSEVAFEDLLTAINEDLRTPPSNW